MVRRILGRVRRAVALSIAIAVTTIVGLGIADAVSPPTGGQGEVDVHALNPVNCDTHPDAIRVNVEYSPFRYCYAGTGHRRISLRQVTSVESRNRTVTVLWRPLRGRWTQTGLVAQETLPIRGGEVETISVH